MLPGAEVADARGGLEGFEVFMHACTAAGFMRCALTARVCVRHCCCSNPFDHGSVTNCVQFWSNGRPDWYR